MHTLCIINGDRGNDDYVNGLRQKLLRTKDQPARISERANASLHEERGYHLKMPGYVQHRRDSASGSVWADDELLEAKAKVDCHDTVNAAVHFGLTSFPKGVMLTIQHQ